MALIDCSEYGHEISTLATACPSCGCPVSAIRAVPRSLTTQPEPMLIKSSGVCLAALLCGIAGIVMMFLPFVWLVAGLPNVLAIVLGLVGMGKVRRGESSGWGMAVAGIITGAIGLVLYAGMWLVWQKLLSDILNEQQ